MANAANSVLQGVTTATTNQLLERNTIETIHYLEGIVSKQLDLYNWCEEKVNTLATIDSILIGAVTLFLDKVIVTNAAQLNEKIINIAILCLGLLPLCISLGIALWHIRPKMGKSSNYGRPNHRSSNGIRHYANSDDYSDSLHKLNNDDLCTDLIKQIYGMNNNIWNNQRSIKVAVIFDLVGLIGLLLIIVYWVLF